MKTFIVRIWVDQGTSVDDLRGTVHDVESGERSTFQSRDDLLDLLTESSLQPDAVGDR